MWVYSIATLNFELGTLNYDASMPRFVVVLHETPENYERGAHFDLMLESGSVLWTWALPALPEAGEVILGERLADHRLAYLDYEGEVSGGRGRVRRIDRGEYESLEESVERLMIRLAGKQVRGTLLLVHEPNSQRWRISLSAV
jgi:hypothetical protein